MSWFENNNEYDDVEYHDDGDSGDCDDYDEDWYDNYVVVAFCLLFIYCCVDSKKDDIINLIIMYSTACMMSSIPSMSHY